ncbi:2Fe-2S iron-sulfur cluster binding domain-containing protein [bacterium]|nr:2Fe-2S iron-sulfur cluster binding domain-containing protein [bacterium]
MKTILLTIDGTRVSAYEGDTILEAAKRSGIYIPTLCHHPLLKNSGACRMCVVEIEGTGRQNFNSACTTPAADDMVVHTATPDIQRMRRMNLELIFSERNHQCPYCEKSGNCELQAMAYRIGMNQVRFPFLWPKKTVDSSHPEVLRDPSRCILCARCVRASAEVDNKGIFAVKGRGIDSDITVNIEENLGATDVSGEDAAVQVCPTGALCAKGLAYSIRYGTRMYDQQPITYLPEPKAPRKTGAKKKKAQQGL